MSPIRTSHSLFWRQFIVPGYAAEIILVCKSDSSTYGTLGVVSMTWKQLKFSFLAVAVHV